jgi:hypothetical protein
MDVLSQMKRALTIVLLLAACGAQKNGAPHSPVSSPSPSPSPSPPATYDEFLQALAQARCEWLFRCGNEDLAPPTECAAALHSMWASGSRARGLGVRFDYDPSHALACLDQTRRTVCVSRYPACMDVYVPRVAAGGGCDDEGQCIAGWCRLDATCGAGDCVSFVGAGAACDDEYHRCDDAHVCGAAHLCVALPSRGQPCLNACEGDLVCRGADLSDRTCQPLGALGESCDGHGQCAAGLYCSFTSTCAVSAPGLTCNDRDCGDLACLDGRCVAWVEPGAACIVETTSYWSNCHGRCSGGVCTDIPGPNDDCDPDSIARPCSTFAYCDRSTRKCLPQLGTGAACTPPPSPAPDFGPCSGYCDPASLTCKPSVCY